MTGNPDQKTILIVDDYPKIARLFAERIGDEGYKTIIALNYSDAVEKIGGGGIDGLITDLSLGDHSGLALADELHRIKREAPVFVVTARPWDVDISRQEKHGISKVYNKPIMPGASDNFLEDLNHHFAAFKTSAGVTASPPL